MPSGARQEIERKESESEILLKVLLNWSRAPENRVCADCDAMEPRWAAWNHGVFVCIRCAGVHRKMGVHISKVKSLTLDKWTREQVLSMYTMGNARARNVYEHSLPARDSDARITDRTLETFIRDKYEHKRYILREWQRPDSDIRQLPCYEELMRLQRGVDSVCVTVASRSGRHVMTTINHDLLDLNAEIRTISSPAVPFDCFDMISTSNPNNSGQNELHTATKRAFDEQLIHVAAPRADAALSPLPVARNSTKMSLADIMSLYNVGTSVLTVNQAPLPAAVVAGLSTSDNSKNKKTSYDMF